MHTNHLKTKILLTSMIFAFACSSKDPKTTTENPMKKSEPATIADLKNIDFSKPSEMNIVLSEGNPDADIPERNKIADAQKLDYPRVEQILSKLDPIATEKEDQTPFHKRADSLPTPKTGTTVKTSFPSDGELKPPIDKTSNQTKLSVLRVQPEGKVEIAPQISVTFSQPMIEITSHDDALNKENLPVKITPEVKGKWRWVGTKTLLFDPASGRLPMATKFAGTIPAGVKSNAGGVLSSEKTFTFQTPPPTVTSTWPHHGTRGIDQMIFIGFNQKIESTQIAQHLEIRSKGKTIEFVQAEPEVVNADPEILAKTEHAKPNTFIVMRPKARLPLDSVIQVSVKSGTPSAEGPLSTLEDYTFNFKTYGPLKITQDRCGYNDTCAPNHNFQFRLSNAIDSETFDPSWVKVTPDFPNKTIRAHGDWIHIGGQKPGRRTYTVEFSKSLTDKFEQKITGKRFYEFKVGPSEPVLYSTAGTFTVLDPNGEPGITLYSTNYKKVSMEVYKVSPKDWDSFLKYSRDHNYYGKLELKPPGKRIEKRIIKIAKEPDDLVETFISLKKNMDKNGRGNLVIVIQPVSTTWGTTLPKNSPRIRNWVQSTQIGLDAMSDATDLTAWATSLNTGKPIVGVKFELSENKVQAQSDGEGLAKIPLNSSAVAGAAEILIASKGDDTAFLPHSLWNGSWKKLSLNDTLGWFVFDDRKTYKPSETVSIKGWIRAIENKKGGGVKLDSGARTVSYIVNGPRGNKIASGETAVGGLGGFNLEFDLPDTPNLGQATVQLTAVGSTSTANQHYHYFQIQEFRTPEFEVKTDAGIGPHYADESTNVNVSAQYYAGGSLGAAQTNWSVSSAAGSFKPPNQDGYAFGVWTPWWGWRYGGGVQNSKNTYKNFAAKTDAAGTHNLKLNFSKISPPRPLNVTTVATVMDVNRQAWTSTKSFIVHPAAFYIGMKTDKYFVKKGTPLDIELILTDISGKLVSNRPIKLKASRILHKWQRNKYIEIEKDSQECEIMSKDASVKCSFETKEGGQYKIEATTMDDQGRVNYSQITRWVSGGKVPKSRRVEMEKVDLIPDKEEYQPGDMVEVLVQSPIVPAEGVMTIRRSGLVEEKRFSMSDSTMIISVPVKESYLPGFSIQVNINGSQPRLNDDGDVDPNLPTRPALAQGVLNVKVPPYSKKLTLTVTPKKGQVSPGAQTSAEVIVKDANGKPVANAEVALVVVDEAILALSSYAMASPLAIFYQTRTPGVRDFHSRTYIQLVDPLQLDDDAINRPSSAAPEGSRPGSSTRSRGAVGIGSLSGFAFGKKAGIKSEIQQEGMDAMHAPEEPAPESDGQQIAVRSNFNPLAAFAPAVKTDAHGIAKLNYKMPDNLTRYRIMAIAVKDASHYGNGESNVTARLPIMVRPSPPRFLNFGDKLEVPVVIQNQTDEELSVSVAARASNINYVGGGTKNTLGLKVKVPANERVEVRFPATTDKAGTARFQFAAVSGTHSDAAEVSIPVWTPATREAFATYGVIDDGAITQALRRPNEVWPQFGGVEVSTSSTALQALTDAFLYLYHYEYQCAEQISSRMVSVTALRDVLTAFKAEGVPTKSAIEESMKRDIKELVGRQNNDGGFGFWRRGQRSWPYVSIHAAHALVRAEIKGYSVPTNTHSRYLAYLKNIENHLPHWYGELARRHIVAYALYVRGLAGDKDPVSARQLISRAGGLKGLPFESVGWLLGVLSGDPESQDELTQIRVFLNNRVTETAGNAHFASEAVDGDYVILRSDRVADGVILESLIGDQPDSDLIPKIVSGLMAHRKKGRWGNTQENAFVLLALDKYFNTYEKKTPNFVAKVWLGEQYAGHHEFKGRTAEQHQIDIAMRFLPKKASTDLVIQKDGAGRMYYRIGMKYAPKSLFSAAASHGFTVERSYEPVDNDGDVKRRNDGTWEIKAGAKIKVKLTMLAPARRYHVALVDPLPAGLEPENPALAVVGDVPENAVSNTGKGGLGHGWSYWWYSRPWYEHQNIRDERVEVFTSLLWGGVHTYSYYARATTPGQFIVPPTKAEEMYHPETFGRSASDRVDVVD